MTCFFIGHRNAPTELQPHITQAVLQLVINHHVTDFVVGHYGRFDRMAATAVQKIKAAYPTITLTLLLPYYPFQYDIESFDNSFYPPGMESVPKRLAIVRANQYMLHHSDFLICYSTGQIGNTKALVDTAMRLAAKGKIKVIPLSNE